MLHILCITVSILQSAFLEIRVYDGYAATHQQGKKKKEKKFISLNIAVIISRCRQLSAISKTKTKKKHKKHTNARMHKLCNVSNFLYLNCFDNMFRKNQITKNE